MEEDKLSNEVKDEFRALIERTNKDNPKSQDVEALRSIFNKHPKLWRCVGDLAIQNQLKLLEETEMSAAVRESIRAGLGVIRQELGNTDASMLEQLLIEQVLLSWLRLNLWEYRVSGMGSVSLPVADFWEKRLSAGQRRFLRASETLARVRRLARSTPALQVNINTDSGQQVNIAGDFIKKPDETKEDQ